VLLCSGTLSPGQVRYRGSVAVSSRDPARRLQSTNASGETRATHSPHQASKRSACSLAAIQGAAISNGCRNRLRSVSAREASGAGFGEPRCGEPHRAALGGNLRGKRARPAPPDYGIAAVAAALWSPMRSLHCRGGCVAVCRVQRPACPGAKQSLGSGSASEVPENRNAAGWRPATCREIEPAQPRQAACRGGISSASGAGCATRSLTTIRSRSFSRSTCRTCIAASSSANDCEAQRASSSANDCEAQRASARLMSSASLIKE
jgi:hypothetical protein